MFREDVSNRFIWFFILFILLWIDQLPEINHPNFFVFQIIIQSNSKRKLYSMDSTHVCKFVLRIVAGNAFVFVYALHYLATAIHYFLHILTSCCCCYLFFSCRVWFECENNTNIHYWEKEKKYYEGNRYLFHSFTLYFCFICVFSLSFHVFFIIIFSIRFQLIHHVFFLNFLCSLHKPLQ